MGTLADELANAQALTEPGEFKAALKDLERVRQAALAADDIPALERVLHLARRIREQADGKRSFEAGSLAYSVRENLRFVGRKQALAEGREWVDPFQETSHVPARRSARSESGDTSWIQPAWAQWAFAAWLLAITATAAVLGAIDSEPGQVIEDASWAKGLALAGLAFGCLAGMLMPRRLWGGGRWLVPLAIGSGLYAIAYFVPHAVDYDGGDETDTGGMGLVIGVFMVACFGPMVAAAAVAALVRLAVTRGRRAGD